MHGKFGVTPPEVLRAPAIGDGEQGGFDLRRLWSVFRRRWPVVLGSTVVVLAAAVVWLVQTKPIYTATTQVLIDSRKERVIREEAVVSDLTLDANAISTEVRLIQSFSVAKRVVERLGLDKHPTFGGGPPGFSFMSWLQSLRGGAAKGSDASPDSAAPAPNADDGSGVPSPAVLAAIGAAQRGISVRRIAMTYFIEISFSDPDPELAARLANAVAEAYLVEQLEARFQTAKRAASWLSERVAALREQLEASEMALAEHRAKHNLVKTQSGTLAEQQAIEINTQLVAARAQTVEKKAKYDQAQRILEGGAGIESVAAVMDSPVIAGLRTQDADLARQEADLLTRYGPEHPSIVKVRAERSDVRRQIKAEVSRVVQTLQTDYEFAQKKEQSLDASVRELTGADRSSDQAVIRLRELERDAQSNRVLYDSLLGRFKEAEQQTSLQNAESRIVAPALKASTPSYPNRKNTLLLALFLGLGFGIGAALLLEHVENGFTTIEQIEQALQLPVLAMVPQLSERERKVDGRPVTIPEYVTQKPLSRFGESIRSVRVSTQMSNIDEQPKLVLITSSVPSEGKTTIMLSLAASAAGANQRVLVIDCDLRHPSTSKHFNLHEGPGLTDLLMGEVASDRVFLGGPLPTMTVLPAGTTTRHPPDILGSERFRALLQTFREKYDVVYIDAPPLSPVVDSSLLSRLVDKIVFVVKWRTTPRDIVVRALQGVDNPRQKIAGVVVNNTQLGLMSSYSPYYGYYQKKYQKYYTE